MNKGLLILLFTAMSLHSSFAQEGLFGFEWTFTNSDVVRNFKNTPTNTDLPPIPGRSLTDSFGATVTSLQSSPISRASKAWIEEIAKSCPSCKIQINKVTTPDGFWFKITKDQTVLEVLTEPMTFNQLVERSTTLDELVWKTAKRAYVLPHKRLGGGHLHLDIESHFGNDRLLFRNFVVDLMNRPELFMGGLGLNYFNAPPLSFYDPKDIKGLKKLILDFDQNPTLSIRDLMESINAFYETLQHPVIPTPNSKFQALNFKHFELGAMGTIEIRAIRPQVSVEHAIRLVSLFQSRIKTLKKLTKPIKVKIPDHSKSYSAERENGFRIYTHDLKPSEIMAAIQGYAKAGRLTTGFYNDYITEELKIELKIESEKKQTSGNTSAGSCSSFL